MAFLGQADAGFLGAMLGAFTAEMFRKGLFELVAYRAWCLFAGVSLDLLPMLFDLTDPLLPEWIESGADLEAAARERYRQVTGVELPDNVLHAWLRRLNPQITAAKFRCNDAAGSPHREGTEEGCSSHSESPG